MPDNLIIQIKELQQDKELVELINSRLNEFSGFKNKSKDEWFSELCFCILTANSKAETALNIQNELKFSGFIEEKEKSLSKCIQRNKHRFHNNKAKFICEAREFKNIKEIINSFKDSFSKREWLIHNIKGIGFKEASHFLRNTGTTDLAILDRHILNLMKENNLIKEKPKSLNKKNYLELEKKFFSLAEKVKMNAAELDLYMWFIKTGKVLK
ncbi:MAG: N-glycosylase/DNA lyase [Candidatus Diapherotrites archaeon]|nr:N-glycosylase/DNA lyase [Candidatus Diapherotrites archaeon]